MARIEKATKELMDLFLEYADGDGKLSKDEFKKMIEKECPNPEVQAKLCANCDKLMGRVDKNRDGELDFKEFMKLVAFIAKCGYSMKTGRCQDD